MSDEAVNQEPVVDQQQPAEIPKTHKLKVSGKEIELAEDKLLFHAQRGLAADEKFNEAAKIRKEMESLKEGIKSPKQFLASLEKLGLSKAEARSQMENLLREEYEYEDLSDEEKAARKEKEELEQYRREKEEIAKKAKEEQLSKQEQADMNSLEEEMVDALEGSWLPKNELFAKASFNYMAAAASKDINLSAKEAVKLVQSDFVESIRSSLSGLDVKSMKTLLGDKVLKSLISDSVAEVKTKESAFNKPVAPSLNKPSEDKPKAEARPDFNDFFKNKRGF